MSAPTLSILLPTVTNRAVLFGVLHAEIQSQSAGKPVEVIVACDSKEISIGKKRQNLLEQSTGRHVVYIDDDDFVSHDYVDEILAALDTDPDCVGFLILCTQNGKNPEKAIASMRYKQWGENQDGYAHTRSPYQKTPVRREIALKAGFPDLRYAEDREYSKRIVPLIKTEVFINKVLYHYKFRAEPFHTKYGITVRRDRPQPGVRPAPHKFDYKGRKLA